jgi:hypothetical protein
MSHAATRHLLDRCDRVDVPGVDDSHGTEVQRLLELLRDDVDADHLRGSGQPGRLEGGEADAA